ncbi:MAG: DoxX family protein [Elusimicrobia bacterium]|nr:DoxX family protein [Elusimicrobiota bacterium]
MRKGEFLALAGRLLLAVIFLASAFGKITNFEATTRYMEAHGMPGAPFFCAAAIVLEAFGAISLMLGYMVRWAAAVLVAFLVAVTWIFHSSPDQRIQLLKNLAIMGGLLQVAACGAGEISLDGRERPR